MQLLYIRVGHVSLATVLVWSSCGCVYVSVCLSVTATAHIVLPRVCNSYGYNYSANTKYLRLCTRDPNKFESFDSL